MPVVDEEMGQSFKYRQLQKHPKYQKIWNTSYSNELVRLCPGVRKVTYVPHNKCVRGADTFKVICYDDIPVNRQKLITYTKVVCEVRPHKVDLYCTRITIGGNLICYPSDVSTPTGSLKLIKHIINSVLSQQHSQFITFDIKAIYLETPIGLAEYVRINLSNIPQ